MFLLALAAAGKGFVHWNKARQVEVDKEEKALMQQKSEATTEPVDTEGRCVVASDVSEGKAPLDVNFTYNLYEVDSGIDVEGVQWDFDGDGTWDTNLSFANAETSYTYAKSGNYAPQLRVQLTDGAITPVCSGEISVNE